MSPYSPETGEWYAIRRPADQGDTWKRAAEELAADVEVFLYDKRHPYHSDTAFLAWCVGRYDATKVASGMAHNGLAYDPPSAALPAPGPVSDSQDVYSGYPLYPADAVAAADINTTGAPTPAPVADPAPVAPAPAPAAPAADTPAAA